MNRVVLKIVDLISIPGRDEILVVFDYVRGAASDLARCTLFTSGDSMSVWRLTGLTHSDPANPTRDSGGFVRVTNKGELHSGMELIQKDRIKSAMTSGAV